MNFLGGFIMKYELYLILNKEMYQKEIISEEEYNRVNDILYKKIKKEEGIHAVLSD